MRTKRGWPGLLPVVNVLGYDIALSLEIRFSFVSKFSQARWWVPCFCVERVSTRACLLLVVDEP